MGSEPSDEVDPIAKKLKALITVTVVAVDHRIQFDLPADAAARDLTAKYEQELRELVSVSGTGLICEEAKHTSNKSIAHLLADSLGQHYCNIDMTLFEREKRGIPRDYASFPPGISKYTDEQIKGWHAVREKFMLSKILQAISLLLPSWPLQLVVICGPCHLDALWTALVLEFLTGTVRKRDLTRSDWFNWGILGQ